MKIRLVSALFLLSARLGPAESHRLPLAPENVHWGYFDAALRPVLRVASGDVIEESKRWSPEGSSAWSSRGRRSTIFPSRCGAWNRRCGSGGRVPIR